MSELTEGEDGMLGTHKDTCCMQLWEEIQTAMKMVEEVAKAPDSVADDGSSPTMDGN